MWSYSRDVNYYETDRMGVIHHSNYLRILEEARLAWMEDNLMPYAEMERQGIVVPFTESRSAFTGFLRFGDTFRVDMELFKFTGLRMYFRYRVFNETTGERLQGCGLNGFAMSILNAGGLLNYIEQEM